MEIFDEMFGQTRIIVTEETGPAFPSSLLRELYKMAYRVETDRTGAPAGNAWLDRDEVTAALAQAKKDEKDVLDFDYAFGLPLKVRLMPVGLSLREHSNEALRPYNACPMVVSTKFDFLYGEGSLQAVVRFAIQASLGAST